MDAWGELVGFFFVWLVFVGLVALYVFRIGTLLREQRHTERAHRLRLATRWRRMPQEAAERARKASRISAGRPS